MNKWDKRFLDLAEHIAQWSKDPSTRVGAVIVRTDRTILSVGYNGFPRNVADVNYRLDNRETKYAMTVHAEPNAILAAPEKAAGCAIYVHPLPPCCDCAGLIIQAGIVRVVSAPPTDDQLTRWGRSFQHMKTMFREAAVKLEYMS
jgi:dCMP deaminase